MAMQFYCRAYTNDIAGYEYNLSSNSMYIQKILESNALRNKLNYEFERLYHSTGTMTGQESKLSFYEYDSPDLYLSLGEFTISLSIYVIGNVGHTHIIEWKVCMKLWDDYDFQDWSETKKDMLTIFLNNKFGYDLQEKNLLRWYKWVIYYTYYTHFQCYHMFIFDTLN